MREKINAAISNILALHGIDERITQSILKSTFLEMAEDDENDPSKVKDWIMDSEEYYDVLDSHQCDHRRVRKWIREKNIGDDVSLTKAGVALFTEIEIAYYQCWETTPEAQFAKDQA